MSPVAGFQPTSANCPKPIKSVNVCGIQTTAPRPILASLNSSCCHPTTPFEQCETYVRAIKTLLCEAQIGTKPCHRHRLWDPLPRTTDHVDIFSSSSLRRANSAWSLTKLGHRTPQQFWHSDYYPCIGSWRVISHMTKPVLTCFNLRA